MIFEIEGGPLDQLDDLNDFIVISRLLGSGKRLHLVPHILAVLSPGKVICWIS